MPKAPRSGERYESDPLYKGAIAEGQTHEAARRRVRNYRRWFALRNHPCFWTAADYVRYGFEPPTDDEVA